MHGLFLQARRNDRHKRFVGGVSKNRRSLRMVLLFRLLGVPETRIEILRELIVTQLRFVGIARH